MPHHPDQDYPEKPGSSAYKIKAIQTGVTAFVDFFACGPLDRAVQVFNFADFERVFGGLDLRSEASYAIFQYFFHGGQKAWIIRVKSPDSACEPGTDSWKGSGGANAILGLSENGLEPLSPGLNLLQNLDEDGFGLLCLPVVSILNSSSFTKVASAAIAFCKEWRAFFILDLPRKINNSADVKQWLHQNEVLRSAHVAVYFPHIIARNLPSRDVPGQTASSGAIAGIYANSDRNRGVWKAPAGKNAVLRETILAAHLTNVEADRLNSSGICTLREFSQSDPVIWGARTLAGTNSMAGEWKYIPVKRTALFIEKSLLLRLKWVAFEPNDEVLWEKICLHVNNFMHGLFCQGAFQGDIDRDAYFVQCGAETTTDADIRTGVLKMMIGFAPLRPQEFIVLSLQFVVAPSNKL